MEIGGYRELDLRNGSNYYENQNPVYLNSGRSGIYHALRCMNIKKILIPYYQCETVRNFLTKKHIEIQYYHIGKNFLPQLINEKDDVAILIVNYFGIINEEILKFLTVKNKNVIFDNTQAFYQPNIEGVYSVYSPRKFFGVPDGALVMGKNCHSYVDEYKKDFSASTASFLLSRIETSGNANYAQYLVNEERIEKSDCLQMSTLTYSLLKNIDYDYVAKKRKENFEYANTVFSAINNLDIEIFSDVSKQTPMVYPLLIKNEQLRYVLKENKIFVGQWWKYLLNEEKISEFERYLSKYLIPIQIDQRYGKNEIDCVASIIFDFINKEREN